MPILAREPDLHPADLLERSDVGVEPDRGWWALYCLSRQEKQLMRRLRALDVAFYSPLIAHRSRSPSGRMITSYKPLFAGYVFLYGDVAARQMAQATGCVSRWLSVPDSAALSFDLRQLSKLIATGAPLTAEARLKAGTRVRIRSGPFVGLEGVVIRRENKSRLVVAVNFIQQGASVQMEDCQLERL